MGSGFAQETGNSPAESTYDENTGFYKLPPLRELFETMTPIDENQYEEIEYNPHQREAGCVVANLPFTVDPNLQSTMGKRDGSGWEKANWSALTGSGYPPDPTGAAGQDHYVQAVNSKYRVYNKDGTGASGVFGLSSLWPGSGSDGDPIVMYDRFADRWFISQFQTDGSNQILIAVSETSDPLGGYYAYSFSFSSFPDYPKFSVWSNAYYMTANTGGPDCIAFEREKMLLGDPTAGKINMSFPYVPKFFNSVAPAYAEGPVAPEADEPCYFFIPQESAWSGVSTDHIQVFKAEIDWTTNSGSVTIHQDINDSFDASFTPSWDDITQQGTTQKLDAVAGIYMYRAQYRRFDDYNVILLTMTVDVSGSNRAGVHWVELRDANDGDWSIYQEGTYAPDSQNSRWMGNCAMDQQGNIALAYSFAGPNEFAGIRYTGRFANDPLGEMTVEEQIAVEGVSYQNITNRYGDYSQMTMDPSDDMTFWFTGEYIKGTNNPGTRIISFSSWHLSGTEEEQIVDPFFTAYQPNPSTVRLRWHDIKDQSVTASLYDMAGNLLAAEVVSTDLGEVDFNIPETSSGIYLVGINGDNTNLSKKIYISK